MKIISRWLVSLAIVALAVLLLAPVAYAAPTTPHSFYGTLKISGYDAPVHTVVTAKFGAGVTCGTYTTTEAGKYGDTATASYLAVAHDNLVEGETIRFYVNGGDTGQTALFVPGGGPTQLNLAISLPVGGIVVPVDKLGLITPWVIAVALVMVAGVWLGIWNRRRRTASPSGS